MAKGSSSTVPVTPMKSGGTRGDDSTAALITPQLESIAERTVSFDESMNGSDAKDEEMNEDYDDYLEEKAPAPAVVTPETPEDAVMSAGRSDGTRSLSRSLASELDEDAPPVSRNLVDELDDVAGLEPAYEDFEDFENNTEDPKSPVTTAQVTEQTSGNRPPVNGDTPAANKGLGRCYEVMKASEWGQIFEPKLIRQAVWADLSYELERPVTSTTIEQVAKDTVLFFKALGLKTTLQPSPSTLESFLPSEAGAELWKWKKKLRTAFGTTGFNWGNQQSTRVTSPVVDPARIPLPQTPKKTDREDSSRQSNGGVFSKSAERSPYFQDSHMVTPQSTARVERTPRATENSRSIGGTKRSTGRVPFRRFQADDDSSDGDEEFTGDGGAQVGEYMRQIQEVTESELLNSTPRIEVATHRPLGQIRSFSGHRNKSENSMQWLRAFVYEMKGTRASPNEWCMPFELSLRDGALHWYRQLPKKTKRTWSQLSEAFIKYYCSQFSQSAETRYYSAKREDKEHVCDYLNRLNGYARNAGIQFENGGRKARDHVKRFLETCGDSELERRLAHLRIKDIHELEEMIVEMLKIEERTTTRDSTPSRPRARDQPRRREDRRYDDSRRRDDRRRDETRDATNRRDRRERDYERHRDDSRNVPRVTLAEASVADIVAELQVRDARDVPSDRMSSRQHFHGDSGSEEASDDGSGDSGHCDDDRSDGYSSEGGYHYLAAANDNERRAAAEGTYARSDNRPPRGDTAGRSNGSRDNRYQSRGNRDSNRDDRARQYGPCAACGGLYHSAHYCRKRCKLCKQVHDAGKCEVFQEIANLVRTKVDKKDLTPELKNLLFTEHLN